MSVALRGAISAAAFIVAGPAFAGIVYSTNPAPGDSATGTGDAVIPIGSTGWSYANLRTDAEMGITNSNARSGNGSVEFNTDSDVGKVDIQYWDGNMGLLSDLDSMSYDWYRDGSSTNSDVQHPSLRVLIDANGLSTNGGFASLVFEEVYNDLSPAPTDQWITSTVTDASDVWATSALGSNPPVYKPLSDWKAENPDAVILGFNSGVGSGWYGFFNGNVDNISWTIGGTTTMTNFEVNPVPLPAGVWLLGGALAGFAALRRKTTS